MKITKQTAVTIILAVALVLMGRELIKEKLNDSASTVVRPDTVFVDKIPEKEKDRVARANTETPSTIEKVLGVKVLPADSGDSPIIIYKEVMPVDSTTVLLWRIDSNKVLHTRLQKVDSAGARWVDLPTKKVGTCQSIEMGSHGVVRCDQPRLGVLDVFAEISLGVSMNKEIHLDDRAGVQWKRYDNSNLSAQLFVRPTDLLAQDYRAWLGVKYTGNLLGN
jgi:hypothetical protein